MQDSLLIDLSCCVIACFIGDAAEDIVHKGNEQTIKFVSKMSNYFGNSQPVVHKSDMSAIENIATGLEEAYKAIDFVMSWYFDVIENPTIQQQTTEKKRIQLKKTELELAEMRRKGYRKLLEIIICQCGISIGRRKCIIT